MSRIDAEIVQNVEQFVQVKVVKNGMTDCNEPGFITISRRHRAFKTAGFASSRLTKRRPSASGCHIRNG